MLPMFAKPTVPPPAAAAPGAVAPVTAPMADKKKSFRHRVHDEATECRIKKYKSYRKTCSETEKNEKGSCEMVKKCAKHGVGSELWPVDVWHLDDDKFAAVNEKFKDPSNPNLRAVDVGKRCMNDVMRGDDKFIKEIETDCGPLEKKKSVRASKKPAAAAAPAAPAAVKPMSKKPASAAAKPASKKPAAAVAKPASKKPAAAVAKPASKKPAAAVAVKK